MLGPVPYMEVQVFVLSEVKTCLHLHGGGVRDVTHCLQPIVTELGSACATRKV